MKKIRFTGSGTEYFKIWIVNIILTIISVGLYYPWAKVRNRRYFYANTQIENRNFEYHATGKQLFIGFLIAMGFFIVYSVIGQLHPFLALAMVAILFVSIPWIIWKSLMFSMKMTSFSNVRFSFTGTVKESYVNFLFYPLGIILGFVALGVLSNMVMPYFQTEETASTLIWNITSVVLVVVFVLSSIYAFAFIKKNNTEYIINNTCFGQGIFMVNLKVKKFFTIALKSIAIFIGSFVVISIIMSLVGGLEMFTTLSNLEETIEKGALPYGFVPIIALTYLSLILVSILVASYAMTRERKYIFKHMKLDMNMSFVSTLRARDFAWVMLSNFVMIVLSVGFAFPWAKVRMAKLLLSNTMIDIDIGFDRYFSNIDNKVSSLAEQIGDAFDIDIGIGI